MTRRSIHELLKQPRPLVGPGIWDGVSAQLAAEAGFEMAFLSGYGLSASLLGEPDFGLITQTQMVDAAQRLCAAVDIPLIIDIDTGYGGPFNVERTVQSLVAVGAAGCFLEDQVFPKRCGHMERKRVVTVAEYLPKLKAALEARSGADFHVTARTDAIAAVGLEQAIERALRYRDAGADAVFVEAPRSVDELELIRARVTDVVLVANMVEQGKTPLLTADALYQLGYSLVAVPVSGLLAVTHALRELFATLRREGATATCSDRMAQFPDLNALLGLERKYERERAFLTDEP